jgi:DNA-binding HxlR family transcriptional regulator
MPRKSKQRRSVCPVACTLDVLGDKWTLLIIRDLLCGRSSFREFMESPERIASNILSDRLERLVGSGLVETSPSPARSDHHTYRLTERGRALSPVLAAIRDWGLANIAGTRAKLGPQ